MASTDCWPPSDTIAVDLREVGQRVADADVALAEHHAGGYEDRAGVAEEGPLEVGTTAMRGPRLDAVDPRAPGPPRLKPSSTAPRC